MAETVLVTGSTGFLGTRICRTLLERGFDVRAFARSQEKVAHLEREGATGVIGDMTDRDSIDAAMQGVGGVVHAAADTEGTEQGGRDVTVGGTRHVLELCKQHDVGKLVYVSSCSVYGVNDLPSGSRVTEDSPLEPYPKQRGAYSAAKLEAERMVSDFSAREQLNTVCLRPGSIYGPGTELFTPNLGLHVGSNLMIIIGLGKQVLPLVHVENVAEAVAVCIENPGAAGKIFNVIDPEQVTKREYLDQVIRPTNPGARMVYIPYFLIWLAVVPQEILFRLLGRTPILTRYRLVASQKNVVFDGSRIQARTSFRPRRTFADTVRELVSQAL